jgi:hypothetical protein
MEINRDHDRSERAEHILDKIGYTPDGTKYCLLENDGSLSNGFEMVTGYSGLEHTRQLEFFKSRLSGAKSHNTSTCGLHVHICKSDMSLLHASKMVLFVNDARQPRFESLLWPEETHQVIPKSTTRPMTSTG